MGKKSKKRRTQPDAPPAAPPRAENPTSAALGAAMGDYEAALGRLGDGDEDGALAHATNAANALAAVTGDVVDELLAEVLLLRGKLVERGDIAEAIDCFGRAAPGGNLKDDASRRRCLDARRGTARRFRLVPF